ncbi:hypothetical protein KWAN_129 [Erwinia phage vB_EamM_Kwan]|uniref:Uncharacterized protein n=1 Tax=Erwinia phage vB_EamM_Kwan TaxID=1883374 RepID=A0A1B2IDZ2_9CAUD|nr:hypothetical protein BIZ80_gp170 [Erwinia phage vB_EamM_Kwan]ANZ49481.1 hypothetical protein KWAN_129 [Erwinia phage vB_EamM_Kwan]
MATLDFVKKGMAIEELTKKPSVVEHPELPTIMMAGQKLHLLSDSVANIHFIVAEAGGFVTRVFNRVKPVADGKATLTIYRQIIRDERGMYFFKVLASKPKALEAFMKQDQQGLIAASPLFYGLCRAYVESGQHRISGVDTREQWSAPQWVGSLRGEVAGKAINFKRTVGYRPATKDTRVVYRFEGAFGMTLTLAQDLPGVAWSKAADYLALPKVTAILKEFYEL